MGARAQHIAGFLGRATSERSFRTHGLLASLVCSAAIRMRSRQPRRLMVALSLGLCKPLFRCRPAIALCHRDRAGQAAGPAMSAMPRKRRLAVRMSPVAKGQFQTYVLAKIAARCQPESVVRTADDRAICTRSVTHSNENGAALIGDCQNAWNLRRHKLPLQDRRRAPRAGARSVGTHGSPGPHT